MIIRGPIIRGNTVPFFLADLLAAEIHEKPSNMSFIVISCMKWKANNRFHSSSFPSSWSVCHEIESTLPCLKDAESSGRETCKHTLYLVS